MRIPVALVLLLAVFLVPRNETEVHKRRCQAAWNRLNGKSIAERIKGVYYKVTKTTPKSDALGENTEDLWTARRALIELGYIVSQRLELTNRAPDSVEISFEEKGLQSALVWVEWRRNHILVFAPRSDIVAVSNAVRSIDATEE
jgi:hypothetical protein